jgi:hypothetical protein
VTGPRGVCGPQNWCRSKMQEFFGNDDLSLVQFLLTLPRFEVAETCQARAPLQLPLAPPARAGRPTPLRLAHAERATCHGVHVFFGTHRCEAATKHICMGMVYACVYAWACIYAMG